MTEVAKSARLVPMDREGCFKLFVNEDEFPWHVMANSIVNEPQNGGSWNELTLTIFVDGPVEIAQDYLDRQALL